MGICDQCGNDYDACFRVTDSSGAEYTFDSFECAIEQLAPHCGHCGVRVLGHGVQAGATTYCCVSCAEQEGAIGLRDRMRELTG